MENIEYIKNTLQQKGFNEETINYVLQYVDLNRNLFRNTLAIDKLTERILNNLKHDITSFDKSEKPLMRFKKLIDRRGEWDPTKGKISINPILRVMGIFSKKERTRTTSTIMHELDHCATTTYIDISENEKENYIQNYLSSKSYSSRIKQKINTYMDSMYKKISGKLPVSGIFDYRYKLENNINLRALNEGITAYKQGIYDEYLGNKPETAYKVEKDVASFISDIIGKDKLISMHFNNDYDGIRESFNEKTGKDLNDLVKELNKKSYLKTMIFGRLYKRRFSRDIHTYMENIREEHSSKLGERNTDFVPKYQIDHTKAIENMKENGMQKQQMINNEYQQTI